MKAVMRTDKPKTKLQSCGFAHDADVLLIIFLLIKIPNGRCEQGGHKGPPRFALIALGSVKRERGGHCIRPRDVCSKAESVVTAPCGDASVVAQAVYG